MPTTTRPSEKTVERHQRSVQSAFVKRTNIQNELMAAEAHIQAAIVKAFDAGLTAPQIAEVTGLTPPRIYQLRDGRRA